MEITFIGCGQMATALAEGFSRAKKHTFSFFDVRFEKAEALAKQFGGRALKQPDEGHEQIYFLAVKPQDLESVSKNIKHAKLIISILTGVTVAKLQSHFPGLPILRLMTNLAVRHGEGSIALTDTPELRPLKPFIEELLSPLGHSLWLDEKLINPATAIIGSGPAFVAAFLEAIIEAGIVMGFTSTQSKELADQMMKGSLALLEGKNPQDLRWQITSPGGTTIAGLRTLEEKNVRSGIIETFLSAYQRSKELGN